MGSNINGDWRMDLIPDSRHRIVNQIVDTLKTRLAFEPDEEALLKLKKVAVNFEEKVYAKASSQSNYLRAIAVKMVVMEAKKVNQQPESTILMDTDINSEPPEHVEASDDAGRMQLTPESRQRVVNKMMDALKIHLPSFGQEGLLELQRICARFEEKVYAKASTQSDYCRTIAVKVVSMEAKKVVTSLPSNLKRRRVPA